MIAHGKNTGEEYAKYFSNIENSYQTSFGFYTTAETYNGKNGLSMRMDGLEYCNDKARKRDIVVHNADYVSYDFIKENYTKPNTKDFENINTKQDLVLIYLEDSNPEKETIVVEDKTNPEKFVTKTFQTREIFTYSDYLVDQMTSHIDRERQKKPG